jgi:hypothetical protein
MPASSVATMLCVSCKGKQRDALHCKYAKDRQADELFGC